MKYFAHQQKCTDWLVVLSADDYLHKPMAGFTALLMWNSTKELEGSMGRNIELAYFP